MKSCLPPATRLRLPKFTALAKVLNTPTETMLSRKL
jgi:hypothetical protein